MRKLEIHNETRSLIVRVIALHACIFILRLEKRLQQSVTKMELLRLDEKSKEWLRVFCHKMGKRSPFVVNN